MANIELDIRDANSPELERAVLGAILTFGDEAIGRISRILKPEMFYNNVYGMLYAELVSMFENHQAIDLLAVSQRIKRNTELSKTLKASDLVDMTTLVGSGNSIEEHAMQLQYQFICRRLSMAGLQIATKANDPTYDIADVLDFASKELDCINETTISNATARHIKIVLEKSMKESEERQVKAAQGITSGIPTGLDALDKLFGGWQPDTLNILAARPSMGKTALMLHSAKTAGMCDFPGCIYSLEMSDVSIANRLLLSDCDIDVDAFRSGKLSRDEWKALEEANNRLSRLPIYIDDNPSASMRYIKAHATAMHRKGLCRWVMIDYLQLANPSDRNATRNREQEVAQMTRQAKIIAKTLGVPVILLSQLSRNVESRGDKKPGLADLRESGAIEQDADTVTFLWRPAYYGINSTENEHRQTVSDTRGYGQLLVRKNRDGAVGDVSFLYNKTMTRIYDYDAVFHNQLLSGLPERIKQTENINSFDNYGIEDPF